MQADVEAQAQITQLFGQQASKLIGDYAQEQQNKAAGLRKEANAATDPAVAKELNDRASALENNWGPDGAMRVLAHSVVGGLTGGLAGAAGAAAGTLTAPNVASALDKAGVDPDLAKALTGLSSTLVGAAVGGAAGGAAAYNEVINNFLSHDERIALKKAKNDCYVTGNAASCQAVEILEKKDAVSNARIEQSIAACEGESCNAVANYIRKELAATGCSIPNVCPDNDLLQIYWKAAQGKAQGLQQVEIESWLIDAKAVYDLAKFAFGAGRIATRVAGESVSTQPAFKADSLADAATSVPAGVKITEKGLTLVEANLAQFEVYAPNVAMVQRLKDALASGERLTGADANFYLHEIAEGTAFSRGLGYEAAHTAALEKYGVSNFSLYHPEVIQSFPSEFNSAWRAYWNIK